MLPSMTTRILALLVACFALSPVALAKDKPSLRTVDRETQALNRCVKNVSARLGSIEKVYYPKLAKKGPAGVKAWFARKDLEVARWYLYGEGGWASARGTNCGEETRGEARFKALEDEWRRMEALVQELEKAKGVVFVTVEEPNTIVYEDAKTRERVKKPSSY